jgi:hypothetical protein
MHAAVVGGSAARSSTPCGRALCILIRPACDNCFLGQVEGLPLDGATGIASGSDSEGGGEAEDEGEDQVEEEEVFLDAQEHFEGVADVFAEEDLAEVSVPSVAWPFLGLDGRAHLRSHARCGPAIHMPHVHAPALVIVG